MDFVIRFITELRGLALVGAVLCIAPIAYPLLVSGVELSLFSELYFLYLSILVVSMLILIFVRPNATVALFSTGGPKCDVFISAPMAAYPAGSSGYTEIQRRVVEIYDLLRTMDLKVFCALVDKEHHEKFETPLATLDQNIPALYDMQYFVLIWPSPLSTGALVEAGFALALKKPAVIFVRKIDDLPWTLQKSNEFGLAWQIVQYADLNDIKRLILANHSVYFPRFKISTGVVDPTAKSA